MNQRKYNNILKSLFLVNRIRESELDENIKFGKTEKDRELKFKLIKKLYERKSEDEKQNYSLENDLTPEEYGDENDLPDHLPEEFLNQLFMSDEEYKKLSELIDDAINEAENEKKSQDETDFEMNDTDFKVFKKEPSFEDLVDWFRLLLLANNGELQLTLTPANEMLIIFRQFVKPDLESNSGKPEPQKPKRKRSQRGKKGPSPEQNDE